MTFIEAYHGVEERIIAANFVFECICFIFKKKLCNRLTVSHLIKKWGGKKKKDDQADAGGGAESADQVICIKLFFYAI